MATSTGQRVGIWIIAIVMALGTIGSFFAIILQNDNAKVDQELSLEQQEKYQKLLDEYQKKVDAQTNELSTQYYPVLSQFTGEVQPFNKDDVKEVATRELKEGDGEVIGDDTNYSAYYIGWNPDGKIFDQSIDGEKLIKPLPGTGLIEGWIEGVKGMKIGGVREITIPSDKAYGETGSGDLIPPHTPLKFIVLAIPTPETIPAPDFSELQ